MGLVDEVIEFIDYNVCGFNLPNPMNEIKEILANYYPELEVEEKEYITGYYQDYYDEQEEE